jgi:hypothetical protein
MSLFNYRKVLLEVPEPIDITRTGVSYGLMEGRNEGREQAFRVWFDLSLTGGADQPSVKVVLQTSWDGLHWADAVESTSLDIEGEFSQWAEAGDLGPYVRALAVPGGATPPQYTATAVLMSDADFQLRAPGRT